MNIQEFAGRTGVSTATVSRAFHEPGKLRPKTRERVLRLAEELGYYPSPAGRALKRGRHDVLGLIWPLEVEGAEALFAQRVLAALTSQLVAHDLDLLICPIDRRQPGTLAHARRTLQRSRCDAWILLYPRPDADLIAALKNSRKPVVCLMGRLPGCPGWKSVRLDQEGWTGDALKRLRRAGCRRAVFFGARPGEPDHEERQAAFLKLGPRFFGSRILSLPGWPPDAGHLRRLLQAGDGIIGADDNAALCALETCRAAKLAVPDRVKIVGIDNIPAAAGASPPLSTYEQPLSDMVKCAVELARQARQRSCHFSAIFVPRATLPDL